MRKPSCSPSLTSPEEHGECFVRIESVAAGDDGSLRVLDLLDPRVREGIRGLAGGKLSALYDAPARGPTVARAVRALVRALRALSQRGLSTAMRGR